MLEKAELYIVSTELTQNRAHQTIRWKQIAMCKDKDPLIEMKRINEEPSFKLRVIDSRTLEVVG
jgi:hypothetical protein